MHVPARVEQNASQSEGGRVWLRHLPALIKQLEQRWRLTLGAPFEGAEGSGAWVARVQRADGSPAVLKVALPHLEAEHEIDGLRFWQGDPSVHLLEADSARGALLIERCEPGAPLRARPELEQDRVLAELFLRLWRAPAPDHAFRPLSTMLEHWMDAARAKPTEHAALVTEGCSVMRELLQDHGDEALLATDLHAGNVLSAARTPWLVIDPKPFVGDRAYDATQHLLNCRARLLADAAGTVSSFADLLGVDGQRVRRWLFARVALDSEVELALRLSKGWM